MTVTELKIREYVIYDVFHITYYLVLRLGGA